MGAKWDWFIIRGGIIKSLKNLGYGSKLYIQNVNISLVLDAVVFLLSLVDFTLSVIQRYTSSHTITAARVLYSQKWKSGNILTEDSLLAKLLDCTFLK